MQPVRLRHLWHLCILCSGSLKVLQFQVLGYEVLYNIGCNAVLGVSLGCIVFYNIDCNALVLVSWGFIVLSNIDSNGSIENFW